MAARRSPRPSGKGVSHPPVLRLLATNGRLVTRRPLVILLGLAARVRLGRAYALWPVSEAPMVGVEVGCRRPAWWVHARLRRRGAPLGIHRLIATVDAPTWHLLRARALLVGKPPAWLLGACARALGRQMDDASVALQSPTGFQLSKAVLYVFEPGHRDPSVIAIAMSDPLQAPRLQGEVERVETIRESLVEHGDIADALPLQPLFAGKVGSGSEEYLAIYPPDPLDQAQGPDRERSIQWLDGFQAATSVPGAPWDEADSQRCLEFVGSAWRRIREPTADAMTARVGSLLEPLQGLQVPWCAVHGDFWEGNLAHHEGRLRVYDWEWSSPCGRPFLDPWAYEVGAMLETIEHGSGLAEALGEAIENVEAWLDRRGIDPRFALATLAPSLAELAIRIRSATGRAAPSESPGDPIAQIMAASEKHLLQG
jgi:hypothetical protein